MRDVVVNTSSKMAHLTGRQANGGRLLFTGMAVLCLRTATTSGRRRRISGFSNYRPPASPVSWWQRNFEEASARSVDAWLS